MTVTHDKPWSQIDDERQESADWIASAPNSNEAAQPELPESPNHKADEDPPFRVVTAPLVSIVPLALAGIGVFWTVVQPAADRPLLGMTRLLGVGVLLIASGVAWWLELRGRREALERCCEQLELTESGSATMNEYMAHREFRPLWSALSRHKAGLEARLGQLLEKQHELGLERSLADMQKRHAGAIIDSISDAVLVTDGFDQLVLANPAAEAILGFDRHEAFRKPLAEFVDDESLQQSIRQFRESGGRSSKRRVELTIGDKVYALTLSEVSGERDETDAPAEHFRVVAVLRDITKQREAARHKSEFVAHVAHELRTPLSSIRAYTEMLVDGEAGDEATRAEYYEIIDSSANRLGRLIDNMLDISRIEAGTVRVNKEPVAVSMVVKDALDEMRPQAEEKKITLTDELIPVVYRILADRDQINRAVLNLVSNAIKYTPEGGKVQVCIKPHEENQTISIEVSDTGVGIPEDAMPRMFEKFYRVDANRKMAKGTGLGLNLVKHIVETVHGGKITLTSEVGKGSTFAMSLPLIP
ncbi:MAG: ATP-binding protein [Planctomycetota bacterium]|nr:ATP-binding protein [Planctomycetota bacterium]